jgi:hypothetical protein
MSLPIIIALVATVLLLLLLAANRGPRVTIIRRDHSNDDNKE